MVYDRIVVVGATSVAVNHNVAVTLGSAVADQAVGVVVVQA